MTVPYGSVWIMPAPTLTPAASWIEAGLTALGEGGPEAVRIEPLAERLGVTKGGFYWHFANRNAFLQALLDAWERVMLDEVIEQVEGGGGDARARLRRLHGLAGSRPALVRTDLAIRDWARRDDAVAARMRRVDNRRMAYMRTLFGELTEDPDDVEARCLLAMALFVGTPFVAAEHGGRSRSHVMAAALRKLEA
jgi:AcrR family transcriptional regulator